MSAFRVFKRASLPEQQAEQVSAPAVSVAPVTDKGVMTTLDMVEHDVLSVVADVGNTAKQASDAASRAGESLKAILGQTRQVNESASSMASDVGDIAQSADEFSASASEIARIVADAAQGADRAEVSALGMETVFQALSQSAIEIGSILGAISTIARQTNLLALNATIEAARAGEAGRGFAVVAQEVKNLSTASEKAAADIRNRIETLQKHVQEATTEARHVSAEVADLKPLFAAASSASDQQRIAAEELAQRANDAARFSVDVKQRMQQIDTAARGAGDESEAAHAGTKLVASNVGDMARRFVTVVRQTSMGNRRKSLRLPVEMPVVVISTRGQTNTVSVDLSVGGLLIADDNRALPDVGGRVELKLADLPAVNGRIVARSSLGVHCAFHQPSDAFNEGVKALFERLELESLPLIQRSQNAAHEITDIFEDGLIRGEVTEAQLFDTSYVPVPETNPQQWMTPMVPMLERWLSPLQEKIKTSHQSIVFCCAVDRNGYIPVHNLIYSQPQRPGDHAWNAANSRNRRIFDDRAGLSCARNTQAYMAHAYRRDMGGGNIVVLKEYVAPITVRGRHWGGFRCAYTI